MDRSRLRRTGALLSATVLLASLAVTTAAPVAAAATPKCAGRVATIVGTNKGEVIRGTAKADVIVAKGGHDRVFGLGGNDVICGNSGHDRIVGGAGNDLLLGQVGRDRLYGGPQRDRLLGGPSNDDLDGGTGNDACLQGSGTGLWLNCERPAIAPPAGPKVLVRAFTDMNGNHVFDTGDVMISELADTNGDGVASPGDTITMDRYPKVLDPVAAADFEPWSVKSHTVAEVVTSTANSIFLKNSTGGTHDWNSSVDQYSENGVGSSTLFDNLGLGDNDNRNLDQNSPSKPLTTGNLSLPGLGDDRFIDVVFYP